MYSNSMIAVCDILGFRNLVQDNPLEDVVDKALNWFRQALYHSIRKDGWPSEAPPLREIQEQANVGVAWFSDTILLYTLKDDDESVRALVSSVGWLTFETILAGTMRVRSGISYGKVYLNPENALYVGTPIIEAYEMEQSQAWCGAALTAAAVARVPSWARGGEFADWSLVPYDVPLKQGPIRTLAVNWTLGYHGPFFSLDWSKNSPEPTAMDWERQPGVCEKWRNTKAFHDSVCRCRNRKTPEEVLRKFYGA